MKIMGDMTKVNGVYNSTKINKTEAVTGIRKSKDSILISDSAKDYQIAMKALQGVPDVRMDKVNAISQKLSSGTYNVSGQEISDKIVNSIIDKKI